MTSNSSLPAPKTFQLICAPGSPIEPLQRRCARIAGSESTVLILGETGTGKEVLARQVHQLSARANGPFVAVNCGAIPETLLESELFGYVKGAFTGAAANRKGRIAYAEGGTLFLDEIGELPLSLQVKLLRVLQDRSYEPVGSAQAVPANFRLIAATNRDLQGEVEAGRFRQDLFYRLLVCPVKLPALRERSGDVVPLFNHFWKARGELRPVDPAALAKLTAYAWPGNVRELENMVERLSVCSEGESIGLADLDANFGDQPDALDRCRPLAVPVAMGSEALGHAAKAVSAGSLVTEPAQSTPRFPIDLPSHIRDLEERYIAAALEQTSGNKRAAADLLGLQRTTLVEKLRRRSQRLMGAEALAVSSDGVLEPTGS